MRGEIRRRKFRRRWDLKSYLKSENWRRKKDWYQRIVPLVECFVCGHHRVQFHHLDYRRLGREQLRDLMLLCGGCHKELHLALKARGWPVTRSKEMVRLRFDFTPEEFEERMTEFEPLPRWHSDGHVNRPRTAKRARKAAKKAKREPKPLSEAEKRRIAWRLEHEPRF